MYLRTNACMQNTHIHSFTQLLRFSEAIKSNWHILKKYKSPTRVYIMH